jgi:ankyrin repeat protein
MLPPTSLCRYARNSLNACDQRLCAKPGMHQSMQNGSMARRIRVLCYSRAARSGRVQSAERAQPARSIDRIEDKLLPRLMRRTTGTSPPEAGEEVAMPTRCLPNDPSLEHLRKEAKRLLKAIRAGDAGAIGLVQEFHARGDVAMSEFQLNDAQHVTARSYGFPSWTQLKEHLAAIAPFTWSEPPQLPDAATPAELFIRLAVMVYGSWSRSNPDTARRLLDEHPELARATFYTAVASGDVAAVQEHIERDPALVNAKGGPLDLPPLLYACYSRLEDAPPNRSTLEVARLLLARGADPNAGFLWGGTYPFTALTGAFGRGEDNMNQLPHPRAEALAKLLLESGADPNDSQALYNRHFEENDDHFKVLFAYGLGRDTHGPWQTRLGDRVLATGPMLVQELCWAVIHNYPNRVQLLVEHGVDIDTPGPRDGRTPYQEALRAGHHAIAQYLLEQGAKKIGLDPVEMFAIDCIAGRRDAVRARLAENPALLDNLGPRGRAELIHRAVDAKQLEGIRLIVELGVDVNAMIPGTAYDRAPLHNAAAWGTREIVELLIQLGADPQLRDLTHHSAPIGWAAYAQQWHMVDYLAQFATVFNALRCGAVERVAELLKESPSLANAIDEDGDPLVFYLHPELRRLDEMLALLLAHGGDLDAPNHEGKTLLGRAIARGQVEFAEMLRTHGAKSPG